MTKTEICNLALTHIGSSVDIANVETERSAEAMAFRKCFDIVMDMTLRDYAWSFATRVQPLSLVSTNPNDEWNFAYRYPVDCVQDRRIQSGIRNDNRQSRIPYSLFTDSSGILIYTDQPEAVLEYTGKEPDVSKWPPDAAMALSLRLAVYVSSTITGGDPFGVGNRAMQMYMFEISKAKASSANSGQAEQEPESEFIRVRD